MKLWHYDTNGLALQFWQMEGTFSLVTLNQRQNRIKDILFTHIWKLTKKITITVILQFLKKFGLFISLIIRPEIMIKSVVTPLLRYILIFKLEPQGREPVCKANNFYCLILRIYFCCLYLETVLSERTILTEKGTL